MSDDIKNPDAFDYVCQRNEAISTWRSLQVRIAHVDAHEADAKQALAEADRRWRHAEHYRLATHRAEQMWDALTATQRKQVVAALCVIDDWFKPATGERLPDLTYQHRRRGFKLLADGMTEQGRVVAPPAPESLRNYLKALRFGSIS